MKIEALPDEFIDALIADPIHKSTPPGDLVCVCGSKLEMGYCRNMECSWDAVEETLPCEFCGCCPDPKHCVWSITCPICRTPPKEQCREGNKLVGLHQERWDESGTSWR